MKNILYILAIFLITSFSTQKETENHKTSKKSKAIGKVTYIYKSKYRRYLTRIIHQVYNFYNFYFS